MIGESITRKEDLRYLTGRGMYVEDVQLPGMLHVAFVRSPYAHANVLTLHRERAMAVPGVVAVGNSDDWPELAVPMPDLFEPGTLRNPYCDLDKAAPQQLFPRKASYVGEQIAVVIAESAYAAADGVEAMEPSFDRLPVVAGWQDSIRAGAPHVHRGYDNIIGHLKHELGRVDEVFGTADIVAEERLEMQSLKSMAMECRAIAAHWDAVSGTLNIWSTSQLYYTIRDWVARTLRLPTDRVRVIARDVGGGFGLKGTLYPEDFIVPVLAYLTKRPLRWTESRTEHMVCSNHSGIQVHDVRVAARRDGTILGLDLKIFKECGAYNHFEMVLPTNTINHLPTHYRVPNLRAEAWSIATHKSPVSPYRGAGRIEATFTMDRVLDLLARKTGLDPLEVRRRNIIAREAMPYHTGLTYRDGVAIRYDNIDFPAMLNAATERAGYQGWRNQQADLRKAGRAVGVGISSYVEAGGIGPSEGCRIQIEESGHIRVSIGVNSQGQGHETTFAQVCAHHLGARIEDVEVSGGDTSLLAFGFGTGASRVGVGTGNAVLKAAEEVKRKVVKLAGHFFERDEATISVQDSIVSVAGAPQLFLSFAELAAKAHRDPFMAGLGGPGLLATEYFYPRTVTWSSGVHVAVVEVDRETGQLQILKYVMVHDCGVPLNPMIVEGQVYGGFAQGLGIALGEEVVTDAQGQVLSGSMMDYYVPRATDVPNADIEHFVFPTEENPLGMRAVGESGPISPPAALAAAVEDALGEHVRITRIPFTAQTIRNLARSADHS